MCPDPPDRKELGRSLALSQVGLEMVAPLGIGIALDYYFGTMPWATVTGCVLGFVGGMVHLISLANRQDAEERQPPGGAP